MCPQTTGCFNQTWRKLTAFNTLVSHQSLGFRFTTDNTVNSRPLSGNELGYSVKAGYQNNELKHCSVSDWCVVCGSHIHVVMICLLLHSNDSWPWPSKGIQCTCLLLCRTIPGISEFSYSTKGKWSYTRWYTNLLEFLKTTFQLQVLYCQIRLFLVVVLLIASKEGNCQEFRLMAPSLFWSSNTLL